MKKIVDDRDKAKIYILLSIAVISILLYVFNDLINSAPRIVDDVEGLEFSKESGFYDEEFDLSIMTNEGDIYYTLDCSVPDATSQKYLAPIHIYDNSDEENRYAVMDNTSVRFFADKIEELGQNAPSGYEILTNKTDKAMVVRARIHYPDDTWSDTKSAIYFVGYKNKEIYRDCKILSILTDSVNLYDYEKGIYVTGKTLDDFFDTDECENVKWREWPTNYRNRGKDWEREADCQFFDSDGKLLLSQNLGLRIHGANSRVYHQKSFSLRARDEYDGNNRILLRFFAENDYYSRLTVSNGGNDHNIKIKDYLMEEICEGLDFVTQEFEPVLVFLDGEYWGLYYLTQKYDDPSLYRNRYGVDEANLIIMKDGILEQGRDEDYSLYGEMFDFCSKADMTDDNNYDIACQYIDMNSCVDYFATMIYIARYSDWPYANWGMWRSRERKGGIYSDGKWRYVFFDLNGDGFTEDLVEVDPYEMAMMDPIFSNLYNNEKFRKKLNRRILELGDTVFAPQKIEEFIENKYNPLINQIIYTAKRFGDDENDTRNEMNSDLESIKTFFNNRKTFLENNLE